MLLGIHAQVLHETASEVFNLESRLIRSYAWGVEHAVYPPDYFSMILRRLYLRFYNEHRHMPIAHFDACFISGPVMKNNPASIHYMGLLLDVTTFSPKAIRNCVILSVQFHNNLPIHEQQPWGFFLEKVQGPRYVLNNFTEGVLADLWNSDNPPNFQSIFELRELASPIPAHVVTAVTIPFTKRVTSWTRHISASGFKKSLYRMNGEVLECIAQNTDLDLTPTLGDYGAPWVNRRLLVILDIRLLGPTLFALGISNANVTPSGVFKHGGAGVLRYRTVSKGVLDLTGLYIRVLKRGLSRMTPDSILREFHLDHRHHGDLSMFMCLFAKHLLVYAAKNRELSLDWIRSIVTNPDNMIGSSTGLSPSDDPHWDLPFQR